MNHGRLSAFRRSRKLPSIPPSRRHQDYWPPFRGAIDWMQKNEDTINTAIGLLEIYPQLIQHQPCDRLWEFISKVAFFNNLALAKHHSLGHDAGKRHAHQAASDKCHHGSDRLAQGLQDTMDRPLGGNTKGKKSNNVYICGNLENPDWQRLVLDLSKRYHVRCHCSHDENHSESAEKMVYENDTLLFLLDEDSVSNDAYLRLVKAAQAWNMKITFVRHHDFHMSDMLSAGLLSNSSNHSSGADKKQEMRQNPYVPHVTNLKIPDIEITEAKTDQPLDYYSVDHESRSLHSSLSNISLEPHRSCSAGLLSVSNLPVESPLFFDQAPRFLATPVSRPDSGLSCGSSISNASRSYKIASPKPRVPNPPHSYSGLDRLHSAHSLPSKLDYQQHTESFQRLFVPIENQKQQHQVSMNVLLKKGFRNAQLYAPNEHKGAMHGIVCSLDGDALNAHDLDISDWVSSLQSPVPVKNDTEPDYPQRTPSPERKCGGKIVIGDTDSCKTSPRSSLTSEGETIFAVYADDTHNPSIVRWPADFRHQVNTSPSTESFGFQDVDLSQSVNNIDWFSDDESP